MKHYTTKLSLCVLCLASMPGLSRAAAFATSAVPASVAAHRAAPVGTVDPRAPMEVSVSLPMRDADGLDRLLRALQDPGSPGYRHYLAVAEYTARFGPTEADYAAVASFFAAQGLGVRADAANRALIQLTGTAADMQRVFHTSLARFQDPATGRVFTAPATEPSVDLAVPLNEVIGLDDAVLPTPRLIRPAPGQAMARTTGSGPNGEFLGSDMRAAYYGHGKLDGTGQSVGLMELVGYNVASVQTYFSMVGQPLNAHIMTVATDRVSPSCTGSCDDGEQALDIEYTISMAPNLAQVEVYVGHPEDVLNSMASRNTSAQLSTSWGWGEHFATDDALFREMAAQGQTMLTASGDNSNLKASGPWPEEDANIVSVGGTDLVTHGPGGAWASETGWNGSAGGPSVDHSITIEPYQAPYVTAANKASPRLRNVPDIAAQSNINMYFCANGGCGYAGGTSFASPMWAGFVAMANQQAAASGQPAVGFINPALYEAGHAGKVKTLFHDILHGRSGLYSCTPSFDLVTGLGSMQAGLIDVLTGG